ncbi:hypothetical protein HN51_000093 [Arachis hypogaea]
MNGSCLENDDGKQIRMKRKGRKRGGQLASAKNGIHTDDEERGERSVDDIGVDIGLEEEVGVGEDGEKEDECGREEAFGGVNSEGVVMDRRNLNLSRR